MCFVCALFFVCFDILLFSVFIRAFCQIAKPRIPLSLLFFQATPGSVQAWYVLVGGLTRFFIRLSWLSFSLCVVAVASHPTQAPDNPEQHVFDSLCLFLFCSSVWIIKDFGEPFCEGATCAYRRFRKPHTALQPVCTMSGAFRLKRSFLCDMIALCAHFLHFSFQSAHISHPMLDRAHSSELQAHFIQ